MTRAKQIGLGFALWAGLVVTLPATGAEKPAATATRKVTEKKFRVYDVGCRRLVLLIGSYDTASEACWAATRARAEKKPVEIVTDPPPGYPWGAKAATYSVYSRGCKVWSLAGKTRTAWLASLLEGTAKGQDLDVHIIHHFAAK